MDRAGRWTGAGDAHRSRSRPAPARSSTGGDTRAFAGRAEAIAWALTVVADAGAVFLDTETTGLGRDAEVVDVALIGVDGGVLFESLIRPSHPIPPRASRVHRIHDADVAAAPTWAEVQPYLADLLDERRVVVYNAAFDHRIVSQCCRQHNLAAPLVGWDCAMLAYAAFAALPSAGRGGFRWHKLEAATVACGIPTGGHRAASDAIACRGVVLAMAAVDW